MARRTSAEPTGLDSDGLRGLRTVQRVSTDRRGKNAGAPAENWLTGCRYCIRLHTMNTKAPKTMTETLRQAIIESGLPMLTLANESGVERVSLIRFKRGEQSLRLDCADKLAVYFGLELRPTRRKAKGG